MMFDKDKFLSATLTDALDTRTTPCPVGDFNAKIIEIDFTGGEIKKTESERFGQPWAKLIVKCEIEDAAVREVTKRAKVIVRGDVMLDVTPEGNLDAAAGRNIKLGQLRAACGLNNPNQSFAFPMLIGQYVKVKVGHRQDPDNAEIVYDEVKAFAKM